MSAYHRLLELLVFIAGFVVVIWATPAVVSWAGVAPPRYPTAVEFVADAEKVINDYWRRQTFPRDRPYSSPRVTEEPFTCLKDPTRESGYCSLNQTIYVDWPEMAQAQDAAGSAGMYAVLAHEWTHHVQFILGVSNNFPQRELQADCGAGMFLAANWPRLASGDLEAVRSMFSNFPVDPAHGTAAQRSSAVEDGFRRGAADHCGLPIK